jgi:flagellar motor switch protein FliG
MAPPADQPLTGVRKAAIAIVAMGDDASSHLFKFFQEDEIERVIREIALLGAVAPEVNDSVLGELRTLTLSGASLTTGGVEHARRLLSKTLGPEQSRRILDRVIHSFQAKAGFASLEKANPQQLSKFILGEHPQTVALILAHLNAGSAAQLLSQLPDEMRADVVMRMASLEDIPPDVIMRVSDVIDQRLKALGGPRREQRGGVRAVADLFNRLDRNLSRAALEHIEGAAPELAVAIRNLMFVFDDLVQIEDSGIREIINRADKKALTVALKGASEEIRQRFFGNMSKRAADLLKEEMEVLGAVRLRDVEKAQHEVVAVARALEEEGLITTGGDGGEGYVT